MALFIKRATVKKTVKKKAVTRRIPRKSAMLLAEKPRNIVQDYAAIDQFGEMPARKRAAAKRAHDLGHDLMPWHERPNDPAGRFNAFCTSCNKAVVVCTEAPFGFPDTYGPAFTTECPIVSTPRE